MEQRWQRLQDLFHAALERPAAQRSAFVHAHCTDDPELLNELQSLLACEHHGSAPVQPARRAVEALFTGAPEVAVENHHLLRKLGSGGMSSVYLAEDVRLKRQVALKVLQHAWALAPEGRARIRREARMAAGLSHPNVACIYDVGESEGVQWISMEYVDGVTLRTRLLAGAMPVATLTDVGLQMAAALAHAHSRNVIHRDIKPENVMVTPNGTVKLLDFGLAVRTEGHTPSLQITAAGTFIGTLRYAAPEVLAGESSSPAGDIYSLGAVLYELATGEALFGRLNSSALIAAVLASDRPSLRSLNPALPHGLASLIDRCISRDPADRYANGETLVAAFGTLDKPESSAPAPPPSVAVVEFHNLSGDPEMDWLSTGLAETLTADLARLVTVRVAHRARVMAESARCQARWDDPASLIELAQRLHVCWVVTGSFQKTGDRVRVLPHLIDASSGEDLPVGKVDGSWKNLFDLQDRVVTVVLDAVSVRSTTTERRPLTPDTVNLNAYESYMRGRARMRDMGHRSLAEAIAHLERAVSLDGDYALAWSGLGTAHALSFLRGTNPDDLIRASACLEKAIALDPELGDPYPWLCFVRTRRQDVDGALEAGRKAVTLHPDVPEGHYFYGAVVQMFAEFRQPDYQAGLHHLCETLRLEPRHLPAYIVIGATSLMAGLHDVAIRSLSRAVDLELNPDLVYRFVGARSLLAIAWQHCGRADLAEKAARESLHVLRDSDHVYRGVFSAISACTLGELALLRNDTAGALAEYRHAWKIVQESARMVGRERVVAKTTAGLAAAYAAAGQTERARKLADETAGRLRLAREHRNVITFECCYSHLSLALARAEIRLGDNTSAAQRVLDAVHTGWRDALWLRLDPDYASLSNCPAYEEALRCMDDYPRVTVSESDLATLGSSSN